MEWLCIIGCCIAWVALCVSFGLGIVFVLTHGEKTDKALDNLE